MSLSKKKYIVIPVLLLLIIFVGSIAYLNEDSETDPQINKVVNLSANSITFNEINKLDEFAELVVIGYATDEFIDREHVVTAFDDGTMQSFHTNTNIKIEKILKKPEDFPSDQKELTIIEPVSLDGDVKYTADHYVELQKGDNSVIFLMKNTFGDYGLINDNLGKFSLEQTNQSKLSQSFTSQELSEYELFRDSVMEKYNIN
ncbi:hypothetical protein P4H27_08370 [Paenibacillus taichungensis]|uniref:hypothetical protein n=1 Tax=Paenibacillus TaxID=44249 RepID=UPI00237C3AB9|nr:MULTISPECIES: hypothetical protein [Paenibacillus]MEC0106950.1 hypothetical protein [Paenibacillus taichungensis]MEC0195120.1 hypothetical protein [Paenibacillus taichungensis]WDQ35111.1 hypothetical protein PTQ21_13105 [Paenibacillus marchantiae]